uniref:Uncharacterized protein n=1 Tax=Cacopsylla melanoneura TaxID=428564 RepID=A0A8D8VGJ9_9HEMI
MQCRKQTSRLFRETIGKTLRIVQMKEIPNTTLLPIVDILDTNHNSQPTKLVVNRVWDQPVVNIMQVQSILINQMLALTAGNTRSALLSLYLCLQKKTWT